MLDLRAVKETIMIRVPVRKGAAEEIRRIAEVVRMDPKSLAAIVLERATARPGLVSELLQEHLVVANNESQNHCDSQETDQ